MADTSRLDWFGDHAKVLIPLAGLLLVVGVVVGALGVSAALGAGDDLDTAKADLATAEDDRAQAGEEADQATARLEEAQPAAAATLEAAQTVAELGRELCDCDEETQALAPRAVQAVVDENSAEYNTVTGELNDWSELHNTLADQISASLPDIQRLSD